MSNTGQPRLATTLLFSENKELRQFAEEVRREHGVGRVMPTQRGSMIPLRYNEQTGEIEVLSGRKWVPTGAAAAPAGAAERRSDAYEETGNSAYFFVPVFVRANADVAGNITVSGTVDGVDVSGHDHSGAGQGGTVDSSDVTTTPAGTLEATDVQAALNELDTEKLALSGGTMTGDIIMQSGVNGLIIEDGRIYFGNASLNNAFLTLLNGGVGINQPWYNTPVWDDVRITAAAAKAPSANAPTYAKFKDNGSGSTGVFAYWFSKSTEEELSFTVQLPHGYVESSNIVPHVHWTPKSNGAELAVVVWGLEYTWASMGADYGNTTIITASAHSPADASLVAGRHYRTDFAALTGTDKDISSILVCRLFRKAADAGDTYDDTAGLLEIDFHFQKDAPGSGQAGAKGYA